MAAMSLGIGRHYNFLMSLSERWFSLSFLLFRSHSQFFFSPFHSPVEIDCATNIDYSIHATVVEKENDWMASIRGK